MEDEQLLAKRAFWVKIMHVAKAVDRIPKNGWNDFHKYAYVLEADANEYLRAEFAKHGLGFMAEMASAPRTVEVEGLTKQGQPVGNITRVHLRFRLVDTDTGYEETFDWWGDGQDTGDKGIYKADTGAVKFWLLKSFLIPAGVEPEQDGAQDKRNAESKPKGDLVTEAMVRRIFALAHEAGFSSDEVKGKLEAQGKSIDSLTKTEAKAVMAYYESKVVEESG